LAAVLFAAVAVALATASSSNRSSIHHPADRTGPASATKSNHAAVSASAGAAAGGQAGAVPVAGPAGTVRVTDAASLKAALAAARPGTVISMADGTYLGKDVRDGNPDEPGRFVASTPGTQTAPIILRGSRAAVIDGGGTGGGYGLHLSGASYWRLEGFTVSSASKGIVLDHSSHVQITAVHVTDIGMEGIHLRAFSSDNVVSGCRVDRTGLKSPNFGEGIYLGSAVSNWPTYSDGHPDASDRNQLLDNHISATAAENIDIKEGTTGGLIRGNVLDGAQIAGKNSADSWIDVKGNGYDIENNHGTHSLQDGIQVHVLVPGWGEMNKFSDNVLDVGGPGVGIWLQNSAVDQGNLITCDNVVSNAAAGDYATNHYQMLACI
jgi:hypothetical protein